MTHSICTSDADEVLAHFQRLGRTLLAPNIEPRLRFELLLEQESADFGLDYAFLSSIDRINQTECFEITHGSHEILKSGTTVPLSKTYCRRTIASPEGTLAISDARAEGWENDPAYEALELGSYLGTTVSVGDELYGTLCFADAVPRDEPLVEKEKALIEMYARVVGYILTLRDKPSIREGRIETIEGRSVSSNAIDSMMDVLTSRTRRVILRTLLGNSSGTSIAAIEGRLDHDRDRIQLYHDHLPKLANFGYIKWDTEAKTISKGEKFGEVEPLVQLLKEYEITFPK